MNNIIFSLKRAFHGTLRLSRTLFPPLGLTAARFDLLFAIHEEPLGKVLQSNLRRILGVTSPTVSRMLRSLEELGLVVRSRAYPDGRQRWVKMSEAGLAIFRRAAYWATGYGSCGVSLAVDTAVADDLWHSESACLQTTEAFEDVLRNVRLTFRDFATLCYPWHPDDW